MSEMKLPTWLSPKSCDCGSFPPIPFERKAISKRIKVSHTLRKRLQLIAEDSQLAIGLYRCPICGEHWQSGREWHFANEEYLFRVPPITADEWHREHYRQPAAMMVYDTCMRDYVGRSRFVPSAEKCRAEGCQKASSSIGIFCQEHQIQELQNSGRLPKPPSGRLFPPYSEEKEGK